jgi:hypothetical protein
MRTTRAKVSFALALLLGGTACAGGNSGVVYNSNFTAGYDPRSLSAAMSRAPLLVETFGTPAAGTTQAGTAQAGSTAQESVSRATTLALRQYGPPWLPRNYTDSAADAANGPYRLRIAYGLPKAFDRQRVCEATMDAAALESARSESEAATTRTVASLCRGETTLGIAEGSPGAEAEVAGERFTRFVGHIGREVMPRRNPVLDDDCIFRFCD